MATSHTTLEQVATLAEVSVSTASRALAGKARECRISEKTEQAILQAAKKLGFQASHVAQSLRAQRSGAIGLLVPDASNPFFAAVAREVVIHTKRYGLSTILTDSHGSEDLEEETLSQLKSRRVEGLIVCPVGQVTPYWRELERSGTPVVVVDRWFPDIALPTVAAENAIGSHAATSALIAKGHRQIGCLQGRPGTSSNNERILGYKRALTANDIKFNKSLIRGSDFSEESGFHAACELLKTHPELTALLALSNQNALGALRALNDRNLRTPTDLSLVMFDDAPFAEYVAPPLSVVRQDILTIGRTASELLIEQIRTNRRPKQLLHRVPVQLEIRQSIGPPPHL